ncbi:MAG: DUF4339 domain-containing protein [Phycisphaerales bacterium]|nr:MAG: DUF4339 domain-containing protein [Phycisphaerales bacterium]
MNEGEWYYVKDGRQCGPVSQAELVELLREGTLDPETLVWMQEMEDWRQASAMDGLVPVASAPLQPAQTAVSQPPRFERPVSVTVFGILNIVFGGLGLLCMPVGLIGIFAMPNVMNATAAAKAWMLASSAVGFLCTILLLAVGIGLLYLKAWARTWCLAYGWFAIVWGIIGMVVNFALIAAGAHGYPRSALPGVIGGIFGGLLGLIYPILLVVFMGKPNVKNACTR